MLNQIETVKERWGGVDQRIDAWLNTRQNLIVQFYDLSTIKPLDESQTPLAVAVSQFCQKLMDYCSAGHFEIYEQLIVEAKAFDDGGIDLAKQVVPKLDELTSQCVDFNDTYDRHCTFDELASLPTAISSIGETLEERFALEDQLIEQLHLCHQAVIEAS